MARPDRRRRGALLGFLGLDPPEPPPPDPWPLSPVGRALAVDSMELPTNDPRSEIAAKAPNIISTSSTAYSVAVGPRHSRRNRRTTFFSPLASLMFLYIGQKSVVIANYYVYHARFRRLIGLTLLFGIPAVPSNKS